MSTTTSSALPIAAIPVERFVERVLHRARDERERFATFDALHRHAQAAALSAIQREAGRRHDVMRFEGDEAHTPLPGSVEGRPNRATA